MAPCCRRSRSGCGRNGGCTDRRCGDMKRRCWRSSRLALNLDGPLLCEGLHGEEPMADTNAPPLAPPLSTDKLYEQLNANIRATDDISFKLLGLVPLISGAALGTLLLKDTKAVAAASPSLVTLFALFAAAVTLGLFRWELRNVQECAHLIGLAQAVARDVLGRSGVPTAGQGRPARPQGIGKTEAEK